MKQLEYNPANIFYQHSTSYPQKTAFELGVKNHETVIYKSYSYKEIEIMVTSFAEHLFDSGLRQGDKTIIMIKPSIELFALVFALFKVGAVPVIVDPGMGIKRLLHCYKTIKPTAFIGTRIPHIIKKFSPKTFKTITISILVKGNTLISKLSKPHKKNTHASEVAIAKTNKKALAIINFTTGTTGPAKGVFFSYGMIEAMASMNYCVFKNSSKSINLVTVPLFGVLNILMGCTSILPYMDPTKPAKVNPRNIIKPILKFHVTSMFASPALLHQVSKFGVENNIKLYSLKSVISGGAPITTETLKNVTKLLTNSEKLNVTWGATEGLPLTTITGKKILNQTLDKTHKGYGSCIGKAVEGVKVKVIPITDEVITNLDQTQELGKNTIGELIVQGKNISPSYFDNPEATALHKIYDNGSFWHRTGDLGWIDKEEKVWFCGRKSHVVKSTAPIKTLYPVQIEGIVNQHPEVYRSALIGIKTKSKSIKTIICIELTNNSTKKKSQVIIKSEILKMLSKIEKSEHINEVIFDSSLPVDIRHNSKIKRIELTEKYQYRYDQKPEGDIDKPIHFLKFHYLMIIPILGWAFIFWGIFKPFISTLLIIIWSIDLFLSVVVHSLQIPIGISKGFNKGYSKWASGIYTFIFGATWWKTISK
ncbi:fatty acid CoA ligase family protein [Tenacibaculum sp. C7A-26P2]|uniref:fatty acid CoA ligase family protein n=1 Tax=Tenacibaculum sp. C7A-26P2 TaxID=3447504 RepID=UPI003F85F240